MFAKSKLGSIGVWLGSIGLLLALLHFWAGPFSTKPRPSLEDYVAEKAVAIKRATLDALQGKQAVASDQKSVWDLDKATWVVTALLGGMAIVLAAFSFIYREPQRVAGTAAVLGIVTIGFQYVAMYMMILLALWFILSVINSLGL